ncbi:MAG: hypothetical protein ACLQT7_00820 [Candidatus Dormibacteria bacterium]
MSEQPAPATLSTASVPPERLRRCHPAAPGRRLAVGLLVAALYAGVALIFLRPGLFGGPDSVVGPTYDPSIFVWSLAWTPFAISHGLDPLVTTYLHYPTGANLMWNTAIIFPALVLAPVTNLFGPIAAYKVLLGLGMWLSGCCAYLALRRFTRHRLGAALGGLLYELSPFMVLQLQGHGQLFIAVYPPLLVIFAHEMLVRQRRPAWLIGGLLGLATAAQLLTGTELLTLSLLMSLPALATLAVIYRAQLRERLGYALRAAEFAVVTFLVLAAFPLYILLLGPQQISGALQGFIFQAQPVDYVVPSKWELIAGPAAVLDSSTYVGIPMLILAVAVTVWMRRSAAVVASAVTVACTLVLALGGHIVLAGHRLPLPWYVAEHLPILDNVLPVRLMLAAYLALGLMLALFVDRVLEAPLRWRWAGLGAAVATLVPLIPVLPFPSGQFPVPAFFTDGSARQLPSSGSVLITPYGSPWPELWQAVAGLPFKTQLGEVFTPGPGGHIFNAELDALGQELTDLGEGAAAPTVLTPIQRASYLSDLRAHDVTTVIAGPAEGQGQVEVLMSELLGQGTSTGGVVVWYDVGAVSGEGALR